MLGAQCIIHNHNSTLTEMLHLHSFMMTTNLQQSALCDDTSGGSKRTSMLGVAAAAAAAAATMQAGCQGLMVVAVILATGCRAIAEKVVTSGWMGV